jgi:hypothetical protein
LVAGRKILEAGDFRTIEPLRTNPSPSGSISRQICDRVPVDATALQY